jgi:hypothetical protein
MKSYLLIIILLLATVSLKSQSLYVTSGGTVIAQNVAVNIAGDAIVNAGTTALTAATVSISGNFVSGQDVLGINGATNGTDGSISYSYNSTSGVLTLSGATTAANYQITLCKLTYKNTAVTPDKTARIVSLSLNAALPYSGTGHYYEYVSGIMTWTAANTAANARTYFGLHGYLVTVTSAGENAFCAAKIGANACWMGGTAASGTGAEWKWSSGPEAGIQFWEGVDFGHSYNGQYANWNTNEPNSGLHGEDYVQFLASTGLWNNLNGTTTVNGYVVEYGGSSGDPELHISDNVMVVFSRFVSELAASGSGVKWYDAASGGNLLSGTTVLVNGTTYYATQTVNGCESTSRTAVTATVDPTPSFTAQPGATANTNTDVTYTTQSGKSNYAWTFPGTLTTDYTITSGGTTSDYTVTLKYLTTGVKTVTINYSASGCTAASATASTATLVSLAIGDAYEGGKIAYILESGDPGYDANVPKGLIAAMEEQSWSIAWITGVSTQTTLNGNTSTAYGTGQANTNAMIAQSGYTGGAAQVCDDYTNAETGTGVYSDWYLPSKEELNKLYINRVAIGISGGSRWSSSEESNVSAWYHNFSNGNPLYTNKYVQTFVRAVRTF